MVHHRKSSATATGSPATPPEEGQEGALLAKLPAPKARAKKPVLLHIPITVAPESDNEVGLQLVTELLFSSAHITLRRKQAQA